MADQTTKQMTLQGLRDMMATAEFDARLKELLKKHGFSGFEDPIKGVFNEIIDSKITIDHLIPRLIEEINRSEGTVAPLAYDLQDIFLAPFNDAIEEQAEMFYQKMDAFIENFEFSSVTKQLFSKYQITDGEETEKRFDLTIGRYLLGDINDNQLLDALIKPINIKGFSLSEEKGKALMEELKLLQEKFHQYKFEEVAVANIEVTLLHKGFKMEEIYKKTVESVNNLVEEYSAKTDNTGFAQRVQPAQRPAQRIASSEEKSQGAPMGKDKKAEEDLSLGAMIDEISKDLGYGEDEEDSKQS